jgi:hypothetical protein
MLRGQVHGKVIEMACPTCATPGAG